MRRVKKAKQDAELDVTSFMNLMIVLVPVLLLNMVFAQTVVLEIKLPAAANAAIQDNKKNEDLELIIRSDHMKVLFPAGTLIGEFPLKEDKHDFAGLSDFLKNVKQKFVANKFKKTDILILSEANTSYQVIVSAMDTVRSVEVVENFAAESVDLFPDISLGDAPELLAAAQGGAK
jgi:biopolymer transport protein ExbD